MSKGFLHRLDAINTKISGDNSENVIHFQRRLLSNMFAFCSIEQRRVTAWSNNICFMCSFLHYLMIKQIIRMWFRGWNCVLYISLIISYKDKLYEYFNQQMGIHKTGVLHFNSPIINSNNHLYMTLTNWAAYEINVGLF